MPLFENRFSNIKLANYDSVSDTQRGCFSVVFRARDVASGADVALKFYSLDTAVSGNVYRRQGFARESDILSTLLGKEKCLQLVKPLTTYALPVSLSAGGSAAMACEYFAVEWLDEEIDGYFLDPHHYDSIEKLKLFHSIVLSVETLHRYGVFHRDLKPDNLRRISSKKLVVAIDLGTAARFQSPSIAAGYTSSVGASGYASPEALCGLAGNRILAPYTDLYALGCLLFELFNDDHFFVAIRACNPNLDLRFSALCSLLRPGTSEGDQAQDWTKGLDVFSRGVTGCPIDSPGSKIEPGVSQLLGELLVGLTHIDYRRRPSFEMVRNRLRIAIRVLENESAYQNRLNSLKLWRQRRMEKLALKVRRLRSSAVNGDQS